VGNHVYRALIEYEAGRYRQDGTAREEKAEIATSLARFFRGRGCRFLREDEKCGLWHEIGEQEMLKKVQQSLRDAALSSDADRQTLLPPSDGTWTETDAAADADDDAALRTTVPKALGGTTGVRDTRRVAIAGKVEASPLRVATVKVGPILLALDGEPVPTKEAASTRIRAAAGGRMSLSVKKGASSVFRTGSARAAVDRTAAGAGESSSPVVVRLPVGSECRETDYLLGKLGGAMMEGAAKDRTAFSSLLRSSPHPTRSLSLSNFCRFLMFLWLQPSQTSILATLG
jgi:hypothetical protein